MHINRNHRKGGIYHIVNRGSKKEAIFIQQKDYSRFLSRLSKYSKQTQDKIIQYCLLPNHFHILIKAKSSSSISKLMLKLQVSHCRYFCSTYGYVGRVFQNRYRSVSIDSVKQLKNVTRYIHRNAAEYFDKPNYVYDYKWNSMNEFIGREKSELINWHCKKVILKQFQSVATYRSFVESSTTNILRLSIKDDNYIS